jgi:hypothetical protein
MKTSKAKRKFASSSTTSSSTKGSLLKRRAVLGLFATGVAGVAVWQFASTSGSAEAAIPVTLYKNPQCDCCEAYASYLGRHGFDMKVIPTNDLTVMGEKYGIADDMQPCHLSVVAGYVVGGHIPVEIVQRVLSEKPQITGINLPGMPGGMPGMPGNKPDRLTIYEIKKGPLKAYAVI